MKLALLLLALAFKLKLAVMTSKAYRNHIGIVQLRILIKTADTRWGRVFIFDKGRVSSRTGAGHAFDAALIWSDPATAFSVMTSGSDQASFAAAAAGKLRVEGMAYYIQWFTDGIKLAT